jgi:GNAT superfamily N-acetyltransferase
MEIIFTTVSNADEVTQILDLQALYHVSNVSAAEAAEQGFVTLRHDPIVLRRMNEAAPSIIAKDGARVAGYALVMPRSFAADVPLLQPMFEMLDGLSWRGHNLRDHARWFVMGQICVARDYRGAGIFDGMYLKMKEVCRSDYDFVITEIAERNTRSLRAHARVGFQTLQIYPDEITGEIWHTVVLDF